MGRRNFLCVHVFFLPEEVSENNREIIRSGPKSQNVLMIPMFAIHVLPLYPKPKRLNHGLLLNVKRNEREVSGIRRDIYRAVATCHKSAPHK